MKSGNDIYLVYVILQNEKFLSKTSMKNMMWKHLWKWICGGPHADFEKF